MQDNYEYTMIVAPTLTSMTKTIQLLQRDGWQHASGFTAYGDKYFQPMRRPRTQ